MLPIMENCNSRCHLVRAFTLFAALATGVCCAAGAPDNISWLRGLAGNGAVAYRALGSIFVVEIATATTTKIGSASGSSASVPEFSPDGSRVAWIDGGTAKVWDRSSKSTKSITSGTRTGCGIHWVSNDEFVVAKSSKWVKVRIGGSEQEVPELTKLGTAEGEVDVKLCNDGIWTMTVNQSGSPLPGWKSSDGKSGKLPGTCSSCLSPDGRSAGSLLEGHFKYTLTSIRGGQSGSLNWKYGTCGTEDGFDNHQWASSDSRFMVVEDECGRYMAVMEIATNTATRVGQKLGSDLNQNCYGDFTSKSGKTTAVAPRLAISRQSDPGAYRLHWSERGGAPSLAHDLLPSMYLNGKSASDRTMSRVKTAREVGQQVR